MFIAVAGLPEAPSALQDAATLCGLTVMDVRSRCAGMLPRVLVRQATEAEAERLVAGLGDLGFRAFAGEARQVPRDGERIIARQLAWVDGGFTVTDGRGETHPCPFLAIALLQSGFRTTTHSEIIKSKERKFSMGRALLSGGLSMSKTVETTTEQVTSNRESFILVVRAGDQPDLMLYESRLGFQCLGADLKPTRPQNPELLTYPPALMSGLACSMGSS